METTPSPLHVNAPLDPPEFSPITPRNGNPTNAATGAPQTTVTGSKFRKTSSDKRTTGTPQAQHTPVSSMRSTNDTRKSDPNDPFVAAPKDPAQDPSRIPMAVTPTSAPKGIRKSLPNNPTVVSHGTPSRILGSSPLKTSTRLPGPLQGATHMSAFPPPMAPTKSSSKSRKSATIKKEPGTSSERMPPSAPGERLTALKSST